MRKKRNIWVIRVAGWGSFFLKATEEEAEEMRKHKAKWEQAIARKRLADKEEIKTKTITNCANHPNFLSNSRYFCECEKCQFYKQLSNL